MKITDIKTFVVGNPWKNWIFIKVYTDEGITGLGEATGGLATKPNLGDTEELFRFVIGEDPRHPDKLWQKMYKGRFANYSRGMNGIEMACWDIKGKALKIPVYQLLGGLVQERLQAYASDVYWQENPSDMADEALRIVDRGFQGIKIHIGYGKPKDDYSRVQAVRQALGEGFPLMVDLNAGYNLLEARQAVKFWESCDITWLEEPLNPNHVGAIADLRSKSSIPIACGENEFRIYGFKYLFEQRAVDVAMPDIGRVGGLMETKNICALADSFGIPVSPHNFSSGVLLAATIHLMASTPNTQWLEMDTSGNAVYEELLTDPLQLNDGYVEVPSQPGLGVELTEQTLNKYAVS